MELDARLTAPLLRRTAILTAAAAFRSLAVSLSLAVCITALLLTGCNNATDATTDETATRGGIASGNVEGKRILAQMVAAYRHAPGYHDRGQLKLTVRGMNSPHTETIPFALDFARPNKMRIEAYAATLVVDGKQVIGRIASPDTNDLDGQVLVLDAPAELTIDAILEYNSALRGELSNSSIWPFPIDLLLNANRVDESFRAAEKVAVLPSKTLEGRECHVVQLENEDGTQVWWIDKESFVLRRFEHPVANFARVFRVNPSEVSLVSDFTGAELSAAGDERFHFEIAEDAKRVKFLVFAPVLPPAKLIGEPCPEFAFDRFEGADFVRAAKEKWTPESLRGKAAMLLVTSINDRESLQAFDELAKRLKPSGAEFVAVISDPPDALTDEQLRAAMKSYAPSYSVARATNAAAAFGILHRSAAIFIGKTGLVEEAMPLDTLLAIQVAPELLAALQADKPWHPRALARVENEHRIYDEQLTLAKAGRLPSIVAAPKSPPKEHRVVSAWKLSELKDPGNIVAPQGAGENLLVIDGAKSVVELDRAGKIVKRHELALPEGGEIGFLRIGKTRDGKRFYAGSRLFLPKVYVFDASWKLTATYPEGPIPANEDNPAVGDVQLADVDRNGDDDLLVGYRGVQGVHMVTRDGRRRWSNRAVFEVTRLAMAPAEDGQMATLVASAEALTAVLDARGQDRGRWPQESGAFGYIAISPPMSAPSAGANEGGPRSYLGIARISQNQFAAVGLSPAGQAIWKYELPPGLPSTPIEAVAWGRVIGDADHWTIAAPDGSIHFLAANGALLDAFALGALPTGLAVTTVGDKPALVVSIKNGGIEALTFEKTEAIEAAE